MSLLFTPLRCWRQLISSWMSYRIALFLHLFVQCLWVQSFQRVVQIRTLPFYYTDCLRPFSDILLIITNAFQAWLWIFVVRFSFRCRGRNRHTIHRSRTFVLFLVAHLCCFLVYLWCKPLLIGSLGLAFPSQVPGCLFNGFFFSATSVPGTLWFTLMNTVPILLLLSFIEKASLWSSGWYCLCGCQCLWLVQIFGCVSHALACFSYLDLGRRHTWFFIFLLLLWCFSYCQ